MINLKHKKNLKQKTNFSFYFNNEYLECNYLCNLTCPRLEINPSSAFLL